MAARAAGREPVGPIASDGRAGDSEPGGPTAVGGVTTAVVRPGGPTTVEATDDRSAVLAALSARLAVLESGSPVGPPAGRDDDVGSSAAGRRSDGPEARRRAPIGSRRREVPPAGGHPEDAPGDPAAVARQICLRQLTGAPRTRNQLAEALRRREIPDDVAEQVLDRLAAARLIDDAAYAEAFVATRHRDRGLGRSALRAELQRKGVATDIADEAVTAVDAEAERSRAAALIARRVDSAMAAGPDAARRRLVGLLARRGYGPGLAMAVVDEALQAYADGDTGGLAVDQSGGLSVP